MPKRARRNSEPSVAEEPQAPESDRPSQEPFSRFVLGVAFTVIAAVVTICFVIFVWLAVIPLVTPSPMMNAVSASYEELNSANTSSTKLDKETVEFLLALEYANADVRTIGTQIAFAIIAGLFFAIVGVLLLAAGLQGALEFTAKNPGAEFNLASATPGAACLILGAVIIIAGLYRNPQRTFHATSNRPVGVESRDESRNERRISISEDENETIDASQPIMPPNPAPSECPTP